MMHRPRLGKLCILAVFVLFTTRTAGAVTLWNGTGANDSTSWSQLGADQTVIPQSFTATSTDGVAISANFAGNSGMVLTSGTSWTSTPPTTTFPAGDTLVWTFDNNGTNLGSGPLTLDFGKAVLAGGAEIQADFPGVFTASVEAFNGNSLLGTETVTSDANGDPVLIGAQDTAADITRLVFDLTMTGCGNLSCGNSDFAADTLISENAPAATTPLPATLPLFATGLGALGLLGSRRKRRSRVSSLGVA